MRSRWPAARAVARRATMDVLAQMPGARSLLSKPQLMRSRVQLIDQSRSSSRQLWRLGRHFEVLF